MATTVYPRSYRRHQRRSSFARLTRGRIGQNQFTAFLTAQATRLGSTSSVIFTKLVKNPAHRVKAAAGIGNLS